MEDIDIIGRYEQDLFEDHVDDFLADLFDVSAIITGDFLDPGHDHRADVNDMRYDQRWDANLFIKRMRKITI